MICTQSCHTSTIAVTCLVGVELLHRDLFFVPEIALKQQQYSVPSLVFFFLVYLLVLHRAKASLSVDAFAA